MKSADIAYVSPSVIPSRSANSVHVVHQCGALAANGQRITLYFQQGAKISKLAELRECIEERYGTDLNGVALAPYTLRMNRGVNLGIAVFALAHMLKTGVPRILFSRNLYFAFIASIIWPRRLCFETHEVETGVHRLLQKKILGHQDVKKVVISRALHTILEHEVGPINGTVTILHDAAPCGIRPQPAKARQNLVNRWLTPAGLAADAKVCGYFGQLYAGRGIEIIKELARRMPGVVFLVFGGNPDDVARARDANLLSNLVFAGFIPNQEARLAMEGCDVLLMPYQRQVSIGVKGHDTARWMSPMKMFEYMASGTPLVASDLLALKEVLAHGQNAMLAAPDDPNEWEMVVRRLLDEPQLAQRISAEAHRQYNDVFNWRQRADAIIDLFSTSPSNACGRVA